MPAISAPAPSYLIDDDILTVALRYGQTLAQLVGRSESELAVTYVSLRKVIRPSRDENARYEALVAGVVRLDATIAITRAADQLFAIHRNTHQTTVSHMIVAATALDRRIPIITTDVGRYNFVAGVRCINARYVLSYPAGRAPPIVVFTRLDDAAAPSRPYLRLPDSVGVALAWVAQILPPFRRGGPGRSR